MTGKHLRILLICILFQLKVIGQNDPIIFRQVSPKGGFTYGAIRTITQDSLGYIWFGTEHGLYNYNSKEFNKYIPASGNTNSLPSNNIRKLFTTQNGKFWVITLNGPCYLNYRTQQFVPVKLSASPQTPNLSGILDLAENKNGQLFAVFNNHIGIFKSGSNDQIEILPFRFGANENLTVVTFDSSNQLWIGTNRGAIYRSSPPYQTLEFFCKHQSETVLSLCSDNNTMWIGYDWGGADHVNENGTIIEHYDQNQPSKTYIPHNRVRQILKDPQNQIWIATYNGILQVSKKGNQIIKSNRFNNLPANSIYSLYTDSQNGIWIGTWSGGLAYINPNGNRFLHIQQVPSGNNTEGSVISSFAEDLDGNIWVGSENGSLCSVDLKTMSFSNYQIPQETVETANIKCMAVDRENKLWLGTFSKGLWYFDKSKKTFIQLNILKDQRIHIYGICPIPEGLWLASFSHGVLFYDFKTHDIKQFNNIASDTTSLSSPNARCLIYDNYGGIWVGTNNGLDYLPKGSSKFMRYMRSPNKNSISNNEIFALCEDHSGKVWIGTGGNGVDFYDPNTGKFSNLTKNDGLAGDNVYGILEDDQHFMWFSTENGISCYNPEKKSFRNFHEEDGLQGNQFNPGAAFKTSKGLFLFGGPNGYNFLTPNKIVLNTYEPEVRITKMFINNDLADSNSNSKFDFITTLSAIKLPFNDNSLSFEFIATNYILPERNHFKYRLINYNEEWIDAGTEGKATFTKIPEGKYTLEIMASNNDGIWSSHLAHLNITIQPPFWRTGYAYFFYLCFFVITSIFIRKEILNRQNLKNELLIERVKNEKEEELHQSKLQLFTNISHEFKTPLTLILSPLEHIISQRKFDPDTNDHLQMIRRNAERLKRLIAQVIDFRKIELGKSTFHPEQKDLVKLCLEICDFYKVYAEDNKIDFSFYSETSPLFCQIDEEKIDKIIFNFLSNSFKYTPESGKIKISLSQHSTCSKPLKLGYCTNEIHEGPCIELRVEDSGSGIAENELPLIFDRFYQGSGSLNQGTGIGLHLCREYAKMHNGAIYVESEPEKGSVFTLIIPAQSMIVPENTKLEERWSAPKTENEIAEESHPSGQTILIVEDNLEMQKHMRHIFQKEFHILTASNGIQGFEVAAEFSPDLIISDVMMPGKNGFELCSQLKEDTLTSHIPVILLTALSDTDKHISGLQTGADAYMTKPFEDQLLMAQVKNLMKSRKKLQEVFFKSQEEWEGDTSLMPADKHLVNKSIRIIDRHLQDVNFSVETLAFELSISRSSLHRKIRALTNQSSSEFIRYIRLKKAIQLMKDGNYNIDEIGYAVGFNSHSYFTQSFKKQFGKTPSAYMNDLKNTE